MTLDEERPKTMNLDLFHDARSGRCERIGPSAFVLRGFALPWVDELLPAISGIEAAAPFRNMVTPGGFTMSVALTNCGALGWTTDRRGYRYTDTDPATRRPWPAMPVPFARLAHEAAAAAGFAGFEPDACLINRYLPGARMSLHQDKDERDFSAPIVSVSLGMPATFLFGGHKRADKAAKVQLYHGDVVVWGGEDRLRYHGVMPLKHVPHPLLGSTRINFTFRKAG
ncbi:alkylated DNA repair protein (DNA oxidative demethylase) [Parapusillimonas granuli]|nr:alkylated DNA repair protein (DNA oxidative demethylase) [Parapusillimonas granuli]